MQLIFFYSSSTNGYLHLWSIEKEKSVQELKGHLGTVICLLKRKNILASASNKIILYDMDANNNPVLNISLNGGYAWSLSFCENRMAAGVSRQDNTSIQIWNMDDLSTMYQVSVGVAPRIYALEMFSDGILLCHNTLDYMDFSANQQKLEQKNTKDEMKCILS